MNERDIFIQALKIDDAEKRADFIQKECGDNQEHRLGVEMLLDAHDIRLELMSENWIQKDAGA